MKVSAEKLKLILAASIFANLIMLAFLAYVTSSLAPMPNQTMHDQARADAHFIQQVDTAIARNDIAKLAELRTQLQQIAHPKTINGQGTWPGE
ncbi:hypothetical protein STSP2_02491 [Anaerohalosphaera lusitana]|uniref:Uncharacterized protein n=1 Tax=Anaerohalosphaera lusitana TaxID=1936003 RepID=A0A1U9NMX3_9BACT|nr:hypothetical protein [Anaerohalosphaera lusitana]AQT69302.1 hypothetical protein STSP2_02491 [Anaerohalosphaera lusitana]